MKHQFNIGKLAAFVAVALLFTLSSCYRKKDTIAVVTVMSDATNQPVGGAEVRLHYAGSADPDNKRIDVKATTDASGRATFNFNDFYKSGQAGFAVLDIEVGNQVVGIIKIEEEKTTEQTVEI
ncbi:MAG: hypothetical protein ACK4K0_06970 [Flavobacteriales bacterium]